ncbi:MaoC family dehydratase [Chloroflexota bacterium]
MTEAPGSFLSQLNKGTNLPEIRREITQEKINLYAEASGDFNPIHVDESFAKGTSLGGTVAHGMLILAYVSHMMTATFGENWLERGKLEVRFRTPARKGDIVTISGRVVRLEQNGEESLVECDILCQNHKGEVVITGEASVGVKKE